MISIHNGIRSGSRNIFDREISFFETNLQGLEMQKHVRRLFS